MRNFSSKAIFAGVLMTALAGAACITPSIPIPPPQPDQMEFTLDAAAGTARFSYSPSPIYANAIVYVFNRSRGVGLITTASANGAVGPTDPLAATTGDAVIITFESEDQAVSTCVLLRNGRQTLGDVCP